MVSAVTKPKIRSAALRERCTKGTTEGRAPQSEYPNRLLRTAGISRFPIAGTTPGHKRSRNVAVLNLVRTL